MRNRRCRDHEVQTSRSRVSPGLDDVGDECAIVLRGHIIERQRFELQFGTLQTGHPNGTFYWIISGVDATGKLPQRDRADGDDVRQLFGSQVIEINHHRRVKQTGDYGVCHDPTRSSPKMASISARRLS